MASASLLPRHPVLRRMAAYWLLASVAMLAIMLVRPELQAEERGALSTLVPLYFLSLPLGHGGLMACNRLKLELYLDNGFEPGIYTEGMVLWICLTGLGYAQWFIVLPWLSGKCRQFCRFLCVRDSAR